MILLRSDNLHSVPCLHHLAPSVKSHYYLCYLTEFSFADWCLNLVWQSLIRNVLNSKTLH